MVKINFREKFTFILANCGGGGRPSPGGVVGIIFLSKIKKSIRHGQKKFTITSKKEQILFI